VTATLAIVVLHHRGWDDTRHCLETLARQHDAAAMRVILVDNSGDAEAASRAAAWLAGTDGATIAPPWRAESGHASPAPVRGVPTARWTVLDERDLPAGVTPAHEATRALARWTLVRAANRGFGAGMNVGLRLALTDPSVTATWLLNNDTAVHAGAVRAILGAVARDGDVGEWGTQVRWWDRPAVLQSDGGCRYVPWIASGGRTGDGDPVPAAPDAPQGAARRIAWPGHCYGASWVLRQAAVRDVGLLSEVALVYGEELDWTGRARGRWGAATIPDAIVWHREGATAGGGRAGPKSVLADMHAVAARVRVTRRFFAAAWPTVYCSLLGAALWRLVVRRQPARARGIVRLLHGGDDALASVLADLRSSPPRP
jgi:GT2 family glycosyltransferase